MDVSFEKSKLKKTCDPGRCHELIADRAGQLSLDLKHPLRLIVRPDPFPGPTLPDDGLDWSRVDAVVVLEIVDTH
jgi:proteic killer suppression protein